MNYTLKRFIPLTLLLLTCLLATNLQARTVKPEPLSPDSLYTIGKNSFIQGKYKDAIRYLNYYVLNYPVEKKVADAQFYLAESYYNMEDFEKASVEYEFLYKQFSTSQHVEKARIRAAQCVFETSEPYYREQKLTLESQKMAKSFLERYPDSKYANDARKLLARIDDKLAKKELEAAKLYFKFDEFRAASISLEYILNTYPLAQASKDETRYYLGLCKAKLGDKEEAQAIFEELLQNPKWNKKAQEALKKINNE